MSIRLGFGVRIAPHVRAYMSVPLFGHARRLGRHTGHAADGSLLDMLLGFAVLYVFLRTVWGLAYPDAP
jgi:hypothetical protein